MTSPLNTRFGPLLSLHSVADSLIDLIERWATTYLPAAERDAGWAPGDLPRPAKYWTRQVLEAIPGEDSTPCVIVVVRGTDEIRRKQDGYYDAILDLGLGIVMMGQSPSNARELAGVYGAAICGIVLHKPTFEDALDGRIRVERLVSIELDDLPPEDQRTRAILRAEFRVLVKDFIRSGVGPKQPDPPVDPLPDPGPWPQAQSVHVEVKKEGDS